MRRTGCAACVTGFTSAGLFVEEITEGGSLDALALAVGLRRALIEWREGAVVAATGEAVDSTDAPREC